MPMIPDNSYWMRKAIEAAREGGSRFGSVYYQFAWRFYQRF